MNHSPRLELPLSEDVPSREFVCNLGSKRNEKRLHGHLNLSFVKTNKSDPYRIAISWPILENCHSWKARSEG
jgi:hypothetical protein